MNLLAVLLALSPVIVILLLPVLRRMAAGIAGVIGWVVTVLVAWFYFQPSLGVILKASLSGIVASLPIALIITAVCAVMTLLWAF